MPLVDTRGSRHRQILSDNRYTPPQKSQSEWIGFQSKAGPYKEIIPYKQQPYIKPEKRVLVPDFIHILTQTERSALIGSQAVGGWKLSSKEAAH